MPPGPFVFWEWANDIRYWSKYDRRAAESYRDYRIRPNREVHHHAFSDIARRFTEIFGVSNEMMKIRLVNAGLLKVGGKFEDAPNGSGFPIRGQERPYSY